VYPIQSIRGEVRGWIDECVYASRWPCSSRFC
jgi:hypothetical protein